MEELTLTDKEFDGFRALIYKLTGIALNDGKRQLVQSRLQKRLRFYHFATFAEYHRLVSSLGSGDDETATFINCITTNKTDFFREPHHFEFVTQQILPDLARQAQAEGRSPRLRVWHAGCSSGEEPYTLGIALAESLDGKGNWDVRQLASDIDTNVLAQAERGVYPADRVAPIPADCLRRHFLRGTGDSRELYQVKPALRSQVTFRQINLLEEWPLQPATRFDMIFCRNVVIYFDKPTQQRLFARFQERLRPGGYLFLGHSESLHGQNEAFDSVGHTIYRLRDGSQSAGKRAA